MTDAALFFWSTCGAVMAVLGLLSIVRKRKRPMATRWPRHGQTHHSFWSSPRRVEQ